MRRYRTVLTGEMKFRRDVDVKKLQCSPKFKLSSPKYFTYKKFRNRKISGNRASFR